MRSSLCAALFFLPAWAVVHEQLAGVPSGWTKIQNAEDSESVSLNIALKYQNIEQLESKLMSISTPGSPEFRKYMDREDVTAAFPVVDSAAVESWLKSAGVQTVKHTGDAISFATDVGTANKLLDTQFAHYVGVNGGERKLRTTQYSIPDHLTEHIDLVSPTTYFGKPTKAAAIPTRRTLSGAAIPNVAKHPFGKRDFAPECRNGISPSCLKQMYNIGNYTPDAKSGSWVGFGSFLNQSAILSDLAIFEQKFNIPLQNFSIELINGAVNDQDPGLENAEEANLDAQTIVGVSHPLPVVEYMTGGLA